MLYRLHESSEAQDCVNANPEGIRYCKSTPNTKRLAQCNSKQKHKTNFTSSFLENKKYNLDLILEGALDESRWSHCC